MIVRMGLEFIDTGGKKVTLWNLPPPNSPGQKKPDMLVYMIFEDGT